MRWLGLWPDEIAFAMAVGFLAGVAAVEFAVPPSQVFITSAVLAGGILIAIKRVGLWKMMLVIAALICAGMWYAQVRNDIAATQTHITFNRSIPFSAVVSAEPNISKSEKYVVVTAELQKPYAGKMTLLLPPDATVQNGDTINAIGKISSPSTAGDSSLSVPKSFFITKNNAGFSISSAIAKFRASMIGGINAILPSDAAGFLSAVAFGAKENLSDETKSDIAASGTAFLATLYGMKMSLLLFAVYGALLGYLDRRIVAALAVVAMLAFAAMVGAGAAALRAVIMALIALVAREHGGELVRRNAIALTAGGMAIWNPAIVIDIGFQASFGSVIGILYLVPAFMRAFRWEEKGILAWRENIVMNLAAQLAILPLIVNPAVGFPLISLISGAVLIIFLPLDMLAGWLVGFSSIIFPATAFLITPFANAIASIQLFLIHFFAVFSLYIPLPFNFWTTAIYYGGIIWLLKKIQ